MPDTDEFGGVPAGDDFGGVAVADNPPRRPFLSDFEEPDLTEALSTEPISPGRIAHPDIGGATRKAIGSVLTLPLKPAVDFSKAASLGKQIQYVAGVPGRSSPEDEPRWTASKLEELNRVLFPGGRTDTTEWLTPETIPDNLRTVLHGQFVREVGQEYPARPERRDEFGGVEAPNQVLAGVGGAVEGLEKTGLGALSFVTSPAGVALPLAGSLPPLAQGAISGGFAVDMGRGALESSREFKRAVEAGDVVGAARAGAETLAGGAMAGLAGAHAVGKVGEAVRRSRGADAAAEQASGPAGQQASPELPPIVITPEAMTELQAAMRGNQLKGTFAQEPKAPPLPEAGQQAGRPAGEPVLTEEQRAAIEFQRKTDEAVRRELEKPNKNYEGMSSFELELLEGMGDAGATAERRRRRAARTEEVIPGGKEEKGQEVLGAQPPPEARPNEPAPAVSQSAAKSIVDSKEFERGFIHINLRGGDLDLTRPLTGWVLPADREDLPNTMSTRYGGAGRTAVWVPKEWVTTSKDRPDQIKPGYIPKPEHVAVIPAEAMRPSGTVDWSKVFKPQESSSAPAPAPKPPRKPSAQQAASKEFDRLLLEHGMAAGWVRSPEVLYDEMANVQTGHGTASIKAKILRSKEMAGVRRRAAQDLGSPDFDDMGNPAKRAALLPALREWVEKNVEGPQRQTSDFAKATEAGKVQVPADDLKVGDTVTIEGTPVRVVDVSPDGDVTVEDGPRFGRQVLQDGTTIYAEDWKSEPAAEEAFGAESKAAIPPETPNPKRKTSPPPTLKANQKQGDLLGSGDIPFNLYGEQTGSGERVAAERAAKEETERAAKEFAAKHQQELPAPIRSRPRERIVFDKPLTGPSGAKLVEYEWQWEPEQFIDKHGEERTRRISDWEKAAASEETGRDIVHQFVVEMPNGRRRQVSAESVASLLGYASDAAPVKSVVSAARTLAKNKMKLAALEARMEENDRITEEVQSLALPPVEKGDLAMRTVGADAGKPWGQRWKMGDAEVVQHDLGAIQPERVEALTSIWRDSQMRERGWKHPMESRRDLERRIRAGEAKLKASADSIESALDKLKIDVKPDQLHAFGLIPEIWNGLVEAVRLAYRGGKSIKEAIEHGLEWLRATHGEQKFDEPAVRAELERELGQKETKGTKPAGLREQLGALESEMRGHEAKGEAIPQELLDRYKELADELGEAIRTGKEPLGKGGGTIDSNLERSAEKPAGEKGGKGERARSVPAFKGKDKLPSADLKDALSGLEKVRHTVASWWKGGPVRRSITYLKDALETRADQFGKQAAGHVRLMLNRAFEVAPKDVRKRNDLREFALTFAVQADRNRATLADWHELIGGSEFADTTWGRRALRALEYANEHWDRLAPVVEEYRKLSEAERETELNAGVNVGEWKTGYVRQLIEGVDPEVTGGEMGPQAAGRQFTRKRLLPNYAEHIARGDKPMTLNALDLLSGRLAAGQKVLNEMAWLETLNTMTDPLTHEPIAQSVEWRPKRPIQTQGAPAGRGESFEEAVPAEWEAHAPPGYHVVKFGPTTFALHNDYGGLFKALTSESWLRSTTAGRVVTNTVAAMKHTTLLFDTFHLGRLAFWRTVLGGIGEGAGPGFRKGVTLADYTSADIMEMIHRGEVPEAMGRNLLENKRALDLLLRHGFNIGRVMDNAHLAGVLGTLRESGIPGVSHAASGLSGFNEWLFGQYQRGAMVEAGLIEFERIKAARPEMNDAQVARQVAADLNVRFGNLGRQGLFKSKTAQDLARLVFLAPQWNESLIRSELGAVRQLAQVPIDVAKGRKLVAGTLLKATGTMILGQFAANQILNYATRGTPTWDNPEEGFGPKVSAWIPDVVGNGPGFFLNPLSIAAEYSHLIETKLHQTGGESDEAIRRILNSRLSGVGRAGMTFLTRKDEIGRTLRGGEVWQAAGRALVPVPIGAGAIGAAGKQVLTGQPSEGYAGQFQKQVMSSAGVKTDQAPSPEQRVRALARDFNKARGILPSAEFYAGDFQAFTDALRRGNQSDAQDALDELLTKKTPKQVAEHYSRWLAAPFTGQRARESEFWRGLNEEQRGQYVNAREARKALARQAVEMVRSRAAR